MCASPSSPLLRPKDNPAMKTRLITFFVSGLLLFSAFAAPETNTTTAPASPDVAIQVAPPAAPAIPSNTAAPTNAAPAAKGHHAPIHPVQLVQTGGNVEVKAGETVDEVVVVGGSATIHGRVLHDAVVIGGQMYLDGVVGGDTVVVLGGIRMGQGAVAHKDAVAVLGNLSLAPGATVEHDAVSVMGNLDVPAGAVVKGDKVNVGFPIHAPKLEWLGKWFKYCLFELRPLAPQVGWVWVFAAVSFLLSLFVAAAFPRAIRPCVDNLRRRPATTFLLGLLTKLVAPIVIVFLIATGVGLFVVPFVLAALFVGAVAGKTAMLEWIGSGIGRRLGGVFQRPVPAYLLGAVVVTLLYLVPVAGMLTFLIVSVWGLGCVVTAIFGRAQREAPAAPNPEPPVAPSETRPLSAPVQSPAATAAAQDSPSASVPPSAGSSAPGAVLPGPAPSSPFTEAGHPQTTAGPPSTLPPMYPSALTHSRAGFWERMAAGFLDLAVVSLLMGVASWPFGFLPFGVLLPLMGGPPLGLLLTLAYFSGMWAWKGTTLGGTVLKLKVVRSDGAALTFPVALVRGLAAALSAAVCFLGFLWIAWDPDKQGWHDKIAGTDVIRLPQSTPLVCL